MTAFVQISYFDYHNVFIYCKPSLTTVAVID